MALIGRMANGTKKSTGLTGRMAVSNTTDSASTAPQVLQTMGGKPSFALKPVSSAGSTISQPTGKEIPVGFVNRVTRAINDAPAGPIVKAAFDTAKSTIDNAATKLQEMVATSNQGYNLNDYQKLSLEGKPGENIDQTAARLGINKNTPLKRAVATGSAGLGVANIGFLPVTAQIEAAKQLPGPLALPAKIASGIFEDLGRLGSFTFSKGVDVLPVSDETKKTIRPLAEELGAFVAQLVGIKAAHTVASEGLNLKGLKIKEETRSKVSNAAQVATGISITPFSTVYGLVNSRIAFKVAAKQEQGIEVTPEVGKEIIAEVKQEIKDNPLPDIKTDKPEFLFEKPIEIPKPAEIKNQPAKVEFTDLVSTKEKTYSEIPGRSAESISAPYAEASIKESASIGRQSLVDLSKTKKEIVSPLGSLLKKSPSYLKNNLSSIQDYATTLLKIRQGEQKSYDALIKESIPSDLYESFESRVKKVESLTGKIKRNLAKGKDPLEIADVVAGTLKVKDIESVNKVLDAVSKKLKVVEYQDFFTNPTHYGFRGINMKVINPKGGLSELQIQTPESLAIIKAIHDPFYKKWVDLTTGKNKMSKIQFNQWKKDVIKSNEIANSIWNRSQEASKTPESAQKLTQAEVMATKGDKVSASAPEASKTAKPASDINIKLAERGIDGLTTDKLAQFTPTTKAETVKRVAEIMGDYEQAKRVATGKEDIGISDVERQVLFNTIEKKATEAGDYQTLIDLANSPIATERSVAAQTLGSSAWEKDSVVKNIQEAIKVKEQNYERKTGKRVERAKKEMIDEIKSEIKKSEPKVKDWSSFIESIKCK